MSETRRFMAWFKAEKKDRDLFDAKFYPEDVTGIDAEGFFKEVNQVLARRAEFDFIKRDDLF